MGGRGQARQYLGEVACVGQFGTYSVDGDKIVFNVEHATFANWDGTSSKRPFKISGDEMSFFVPSASAGAGSSSVVSWKRQKQPGAA